MQLLKVFPHLAGKLLFGDYMSEKRKLTELFAALQKEMIAKADFSTAVNHPVDKGDNSEANWINWFNTYFPQRYRAVKATVFDSRGNMSDQIDIVLYDAQYSYLGFNENDILYVPAESVYAVFEVKQILNKGNMEYAGEKAESVRKLYRTSTEIPYAKGKYPPKQLHRILAGILVIESGWKSPYSKPFKKCIDAYSEMQQIDCGCILTEGSFFYDYEKGVLNTSIKEEALVYFFLNFLILLQDIGTVPAIDLAEYAKVLSVRQESIFN